MKWSIYYQLLLPFLALQLCTVFLVILATGYISYQQIQKAEVQHVRQVISTLERAKYPLTPKIMEQLKSLTGAEFVLVNANSEIQSSTFIAASELKESIEEFLNKNNSEIVSIPILQKTEYLAGLYQSSPAQGDFNVIVLYPQSLWSQTLSKLITPYIVLGIIFFVITFGVSYYISSSFTLRLKRLNDHVAQLGLLKFSEMPQEKWKDELNELTGGINKMTQLLDQAFRHTQLQERMRILSQLVGGISHQLRNSLTGVRLALQLHQKSCQSEDQETLSKGLQQLRFIEEEIKTLLRVSKGSEMVQVPGSLQRVLKESIQLLLPYCQHLQIDFQTQISNYDIELADAEGFRAALMNLLINATEAAGPQGKVQLVSHETENHFILQVRDNGPGVNEEIQDKIYEAFFTTKPEGAGLGLALARQTIHDNGAELIYTRENGWTIFSIHF